MKKTKVQYYQVESENGEQWRVPIDAIVQNRSEYYAEKDNVSYEEAEAETIELFNSDTYEIEDWARNNMNWSDVSGQAILHQTKSVVMYDDMWCNPVEVEFVEWVTPK